MADLNSVNLIGRLTKDATLKSLSTGTELCEFSIANNRGFGDKEKCNFFDVKFWGKGASAINKYLVKGKRVGITGELVMESWNDKDTGAKRTKVIVSTFDVQLMDGGEQRDSRDEYHPDFERMSDDEFNARYAKTRR